MNEGYSLFYMLDHAVKNGYNLQLKQGDFIQD